VYLNRGRATNCVGAEVGADDGVEDGAVDGVIDGRLDGFPVGLVEGAAVGVTLGAADGFGVVGVVEGALLGEIVGLNDGNAVGCATAISVNAAMSDSAALEACTTKDEAVRTVPTVPEMIPVDVENIRSGDKSPKSRPHESAAPPSLIGMISTYSPTMKLKTEEA
jgi:hypothetical protein